MDHQKRYLSPQSFRSQVTAGILSNLCRQLDLWRLEQNFGFHFVFQRRCVDILHQRVGVNTAQRSVWFIGAETQTPSCHCCFMWGHTDRMVVVQQQKKQRLVSSRSDYSASSAHEASRVAVTTLCVVFLLLCSPPPSFTYTTLCTLCLISLWFISKARLHTRFPPWTIKAERLNDQSEKSVDSGGSLWSRVISFYGNSALPRKTIHCRLTAEIL